MKYILVTGAYGGMGRATVKALVEKGYNVFALDKKVDAETVKTMIQEHSEAVVEVVEF